MDANQEPGREDAPGPELEGVLRDPDGCVSALLDLPVDLPAIIGGKVRALAEERVIALRPEGILPGPPECI